VMDEDRTMGAADDHLTAAENWLVLAEGQRETLEGGTDVHDAADAVTSGMQTGLLFSTAATLADLHRKMAETYWGYPRTVVTSAAERPGDVLDAAQTPPCDCCSAGLFSGGETCDDCDHGPERHNGNAPMKGGNVPVSEFSRGLDAEKVLIKASILAQNASKHRTAKWLRACADANRVGAEWPLAPQYKGPLQDLDALTSDMLGQVRDAAQAELVARAQAEVVRRSQARPRGGAGQWNG
jgi:hypothetical protein